MSTSIPVTLSETVTYAEIHQQPAMWRAVAAATVERHDELHAFLDPVLARPGLRIILTGAGTSAFAGAILAPALTRVLRRRVDAVATTDIVSNPQHVLAEDAVTLLVSFARSGDSPESLAATDLADDHLSEVHHLVVTCHGAGRLAAAHDGRSSSLVLAMPAPTHDRGFAMTSSFTSMLLAAWLALAPEPDPTGLADDLAVAVEPILAADDWFAERAARGYQRVVYLGSGPLVGLARESALKLLELTAGGVVSYFDTALGFRHGPKAVLREGTLVVVYRSNDPGTAPYDADIVTELRGVIGDDHVVVVEAPSGAAATTVVGPTWSLGGLDGIDDAALAVADVVVAQLIGLHTSLALGCTPDNPFPSGVVNRVVQGVVLHPSTKIET